MMFSSFQNTLVQAYRDFEQSAATRRKRVAVELSIYAAIAGLCAVLYVIKLLVA